MTSPLALHTEGQPLQCPNEKPQIYSIEGYFSYLFVDVNCNEEIDDQDVLIAYDAERLKKIEQLKCQDDIPYLWAPLGIGNMGMPIMIAKRKFKLGVARKETLADFLEKEKGTHPKLIKYEGFGKPDEVDQKTLEAINAILGGEDISEPAVHAEVEEAPLVEEASQLEEDSAVCQTTGFFPPYDPHWSEEKQKAYFEIQNWRAEWLLSYEDFTGDPLAVWGLLDSMAYACDSDNMALWDQAQAVGYMEPASVLVMEKWPEMFQGPFRRMPGVGLVCGERLWVSEVEGMRHRTDEEVLVSDMTFRDLAGNEHSLYEFLNVHHEIPPPKEAKIKKMSYTGGSVNVYWCSIHDSHNLDYIKNVIIPFVAEQNMGAHPDVQTVLLFNDPEGDDPKIREFVTDNQIEEIGIPVWRDPEGKFQHQKNITAIPGLMYTIHPQISKEGEISGFHNGPRFFANQYSLGPHQISQDLNGDGIRTGYEYFATHPTMPDWHGFDQFGWPLSASDVNVGGGEFITHFFVSLDDEYGIALRGQDLIDRLDQLTESLDSFYTRHEKEFSFRNVRIVPLFLGCDDEAMGETQHYFQYHKMPNDEYASYSAVFVDAMTSEDLIYHWELDKEQLNSGAFFMSVQGPYKQENASSEYVGGGDRLAVNLLPGKVAPSIEARYLNRAGHFDPSKQSGKYSIIFFANPDGHFYSALEHLQGRLKRTNATITILGTEEPPDTPTTIPWAVIDKETLKENYHADEGMIIVGPDGKIIHYTRPVNYSENLGPTLIDIFLRNGGNPDQVFVKERMKQYRQEIIDQRQEVQQTRQSGSNDLLVPEGPIDFSIISPSGRKMKISDLYNNGKTTVIVNWATYCQPCIDHLDDYKELAELAAKNKDNVNFVFLNAEGEEVPLSHNSEVLKDFVKKHKLKVPIHSASMSDLKREFDQKIEKQLGRELGKGKKFGFPELIVICGGSSICQRGQVMKRVVLDDAGVDLARMFIGMHGH